MTDNVERNTNVVEALESVVRAGNHALNSAPDLMRRAIQEGCWMHFATKRGEVVRHESFRDFITALPLKGLGISIEEGRRLIGHDLHALSIFNASLGVLETPEEQAPASRVVAPQTAKALERLLEIDPQLHEDVQVGKRSANSALVAAGLRSRIFTVKAGDANAAVRALRKNLSPSQLEEVRRLLAE